MLQEGCPVETKSAQRQAFAHYLRTGRRPELELKFNPYHDPRNGQFTFAPGGPRSLSYVVISDRKQPPGPPRPGGNYRAFWTPMTLQQVFPGLGNAPGGAIIAVADNLLDVMGPASRLTTSLTRQYTDVLIGQIQEIDPSYRFPSLGVPVTLVGQVNQINYLRLIRAATLYRVRGETGTLQVETVRHLQPRVDAAYAAGLRRLEAGTLDPTPTRSVALGNFIDREMRRELRILYNGLGISIRPGEQVRVVGREYDRTGTDLTYRIPDARIGRVAFDVTLTRKTLSTPQIRGYFRTEFQPTSVVILRPTQLGRNSTYIITRPRIEHVPSP